MPAPLGAQPAPAPVAAVEQGQVEKFSTPQLEALLAPIALYPDALPVGDRGREPVAGAGDEQGSQGQGA